MDVRDRYPGEDCDGPLDDGYRTPLFGEPWEAPCCAPNVVVRIATPVGERCLWCEEPIVAGDRGILMGTVEVGAVAGTRPIHAECYTRMGLGSIGHRRKRCSCYGGHEEDPPGVSKREAARLVWRDAGFDAA